jgi:hypothetical protein
MFLNRNPYSYSKIDKMHARCPHCNENYWPEPGFYYGSMFVSYALSIALSVSVFVAMNVLWTFEVLPFLAINAVILLAAFPWMFRTSRAMWLNIFVQYQPPEDQKIKEDSLTTNNG